jgi:SOS-response transcriptional repressor LexA
MSPHTVYSDPVLPRDVRIFGFIKAYKQDHDGNSPTIREIGEASGIASTSLVLFYLNKLEKQGLIRRPEPEFGHRFAATIEVVGGLWRMEE